MKQLELAEARKESGQEQVEDHSDGWVGRMRRYAIGVARMVGEVTADDLRTYAVRCDDEPHHPNAWGAVFKGKGWKLSGYRKSKHVTNNARVIGVWTYDG